MLGRRRERNFNLGKDKDAFYFRNREGGNSNPIIGDPAWVQAVSMARVTRSFDWISK